MGYQDNKAFPGSGMKKYFSSSGFALIYEDEFYTQKVVNKKINNSSLQLMHSFLKVNTPIKIINHI